MIIILEKGGFDWVAFAGAVISALAVIVAISAVWFQYWQFRKQREPVIGPAIKEFDLELPETHLDWKTGEKLDKNFSKTTIPLYNYGGTAAINIAYSYRCNNLHELKENINGKFEFEYETGQYDIQIDSINDEKESFDVWYKNPTSGQKIIHDIRRHKRYRDAIEPGGKTDILLPSYFLVILNHVFGATATDRETFPELELSVTYNDVNHKYYNVKYIIKLGRYKQTMSSQGIHLECILVSEFVSKEKLKGIIHLNQ